MNQAQTVVILRDFTAHFSDRGLARLELTSTPRPTRAVNQRADELPPRVQSWLKATEDAVQQVLAGKRPSRLPPVDLGNATAFQTKVWAALQSIPPGETRSYRQIAAMIGRPNAARAVGQACGANPIPLLIPCHRAVAANGGLGGFSAGLDWKKRLLAAEHATAPQPLPTQASPSSTPSDLASRVIRFSSTKA